MPRVKVSEIEGCLTGKLEATEKDSKHRRFKVFDDNGNLVATTSLSHGWRASDEISDQMFSLIRRELRLDRASELSDLIACPLSRADYLKIATGSP